MEEIGKLIWQLFFFMKRLYLGNKVVLRKTRHSFIVIKKRKINLIRKKIKLKYFPADTQKVVNNVLELHIYKLAEFLSQTRKIRVSLGNFFIK